MLCVLLGFRCLLFSSEVSVGKTYSFVIFGVALAVANCKCVWLLALAYSFSLIIFVCSFFPFSAGIILNPTFEPTEIFGVK